MKKEQIVKYLISFVCVVIVALGICTQVNAETKTVTNAKEGKTYEIDLDQDGSNEAIKLVQKPISKDCPDNYYGILYLDGKKVYTTSKEVYGFDVGMKFVTCGKQVFINLYQSAESDIIVMNKLLYLQDTKLVEAIDILQSEPCVRDCEVTGATDGKITVSCNAMPCQLASIMWNATYKVEGSKVTLKSNVHKVKSGIERDYNSTLTTNRSVSFMKVAGGKEVSFKLAANQKVKLLSIKTKGNKIYGYFQYGDKKGYVRVDPYYTKAYFKNVYKYLAG